MAGGSRNPATRGIVTLSCLPCPSCTHGRIFHYGYATDTVKCKSCGATHTAKQVLDAHENPNRNRKAMTVDAPRIYSE